METTSISKAVWLDLKTGEQAEAKNLKENGMARTTFHLLLLEVYESARNQLILVLFSANETHQNASLRFQRERLRRGDRGTLIRAAGAVTVQDGKPSITYTNVNLGPQSTNTPHASIGSVLADKLKELTTRTGTDSHSQE